MCLPRNMYQYGADWIGVDISENQIKQAKYLSEKKGMKIAYVVSPIEELEFSGNSFDVITACQCFWYFNHDIIAPKLVKMLKKMGGYSSFIWHSCRMKIKLQEKVKSWF